MPGTNWQPSHGCKLNSCCDAESGAPTQTKAACDSRAGSLHILLVHWIYRRKGNHSARRWPTVPIVSIRGGSVCLGCPCRTFIGTLATHSSGSPTLGGRCSDDGLLPDFELLGGFPRIAGRHHGPDGRPAAFVDGGLHAHSGQGVAFTLNVVGPDHWFGGRGLGVASEDDWQPADTINVRRSSGSACCRGRDLRHAGPKKASG